MGLTCSEHSFLINFIVRIVLRNNARIITFIICGWYKMFSQFSEKIINDCLSLNWDCTDTTLRHNNTLSNFPNPWCCLIQCHESMLGQTIISPIMRFVYWPCRLNLLPPMLYVMQNGMDRNHLQSIEKKIRALKKKQDRV